MNRETSPSPSGTQSEPGQSGPETVLQEAQRLVYGDRNASYGHPIDHFSRTVGAINAMFTETVKARLAAGEPMFTPEDWAKFLILDKVSRSVAGYKRDNMVDTAGYAGTHERVIEERGRRHHAACEAAIKQDYQAAMAADPIPSLVGRARKDDLGGIAGYRDWDPRTPK